MTNLLATIKLFNFLLARTCLAGRQDVVAMEVLQEPAAQLEFGGEHRMAEMTELSSAPGRHRTISDGEQSATMGSHICASSDPRDTARSCHENFAFHSNCQVNQARDAELQSTMINDSQETDHRGTLNRALVSQETFHPHDNIPNGEVCSEDPPSQTDQNISTENSQEKGRLIMNEYNPAGCSICFEEIHLGPDDPDNPIFSWTRCNHSFHLECIGKWWELFRYSCPICRRTISGREQEEEQEVIAPMIPTFACSLHCFLDQTTGGFSPVIIGAWALFFFCFAMLIKTLADDVHFHRPHQA
ncbi:hypothetical protein PGT21_008279 [Puccinia graminis f. sp. tritici]|uniref:RING-type domain-containing protein n=1 Tax=Puccinia graminis f. sp. tritici TaxID=56615 RepID=A0A5B0RHM9_PUCGR|nr:hypothetical protein PGT21_008279 [Puccinia graminis f. sp. tritici]KAA1124294.1 hypothetical protein PGTUg99_023459 [Puccinia graminis f. sp. tritici]